MSESTLEKLKRKTTHKEFERKVEVAKKEQVKRRVEQVHLSGAIYIKPLALHEPTT
jgi:hypothetical protein